MVNRAQVWFQGACLGFIVAACGAPAPQAVERSSEPLIIGGFNGDVQLDFGRNVVCRIMRAGGPIDCHGDNTNGQIGVGFGSPDANGSVSLPPSWVPPVVSSTTPIGFHAVSVGGRHVCARAFGSIFCWGANSYGQVGIGTLAQQNRIVQVGTARDWIQVTSGLFHTCGVRRNETTNNYELYCWGQNLYGQLGLGDLNNRSLPTLVRTSSHAMSVSTGDAHTCINDSGSGIWCFGQNSNGQLGDGTTLPRNLPTPVAPGAWASVDAGAVHTCGVRADGALFCWGSNAAGRLGDGTGVTRLRPTRIAANQTWSAVAAGVGHTCALTTGGQVWCFGDNARGQLGRISPAYTLLPLQLALTQLSGFNFRAVVAGSGTCVAGGNQWFCAGPNGSGEIGGLGPGPVPRGMQPRAVAMGLTPLRQAAVGGRHACAVHEDGGLWCSGLASGGQLGVSGIGARDEFQLVGSAHDWVLATAGTSHTCGIRGGGALYCFGLNGSGQIGDGTIVNRTTPTRIAGNWGTASAGLSHTCGVRSNGDLYCWGLNTSGQLGDGTTTNRSAPVLVGTEYQSVAAGDNHTCGLRTSGDLYCWGDNVAGQLGNGSTIRSARPVLVGSNYQAVAAGGGHTCAINAGQLLCWGRNSAGQLGNTGANRLRPLRVGTTADWTMVVTGTNHTCGTRQGVPVSPNQVADEVHCFGLNLAGQLGDSTILSRSAPVRTFVLSRISSLSSRADTTCATGYYPHVPTAAGLRSLYCWGENGDGAFGEGSAWISNFDAPATCGTMGTDCGSIGVCRDDRSCSCFPGWTRDAGGQCVDTDECAANNGGCDPIAICSNAPGYRYCSCPAGYTGDGLRCVDIDECSTNNGGCGPNSSCQNRPGSFACVCAADYAECDGVSSNGCESLASDPNNCGQCGFSCGGAGYTCTDRMCGFQGSLGEGTGSVIDNAQRLSSNPLGNWSFGTLSADTTGNFIPFDAVGNDGQGNFAWHASANSSMGPPRVLLSRAGRTSPFPGATLYPSAIGLQPGATAAVLRWTAPAAGVFQIDANTQDAVDIVQQSCHQEWVCDFWFIWCWSSHYETRCDVPTHQRSSAYVVYRIDNASPIPTMSLLGPHFVRHFERGDDFLLIANNMNGTSLEDLFVTQVSIRGGCPPDRAECDGVLSGEACETPLGTTADCAACADACDARASCTNSTCVCDPGYDGDGHVCGDLDECANHTASCAPNASCSNTPGSYACTCLPGFEGDGFACADVDECATGHGGCDNHAACSNFPGSYSCACDAGYGGDGITCTRLCGDGLLDPGEECDDGNSNMDDGCEPNCTRSRCDLDRMIALPQTGLSRGMSASGHVISTSRGVTGEIYDWTSDSVLTGQDLGLLSADASILVTSRSGMIIVVDRLAATTTTIASAGRPTDISMDGRFIVFESNLANLVTADTNQTTDVFVYDRATGTTSRESVASGGTEADGYSLEGRISADGLRVVFLSGATNLVPGDGNQQADIFLRRRDLGTTTRLSVSATGAELTTAAIAPRIDAQGAVYFMSIDPALPHLGGDFDIYRALVTSQGAADVSLVLSTIPTFGFPTQDGSPFELAADGRSLRAYAVDSRLLRIELPSGQATALNIGLDGVADPAIQGGGGGISADGQFLSFTSFDIHRPSGSSGTAYIRQLRAPSCGSSEVISVSRRFDRPNQPLSVYGSGFERIANNLRAIYQGATYPVTIASNHLLEVSLPLVVGPAGVPSLIPFVFSSSTSTSAPAFSVDYSDCGNAVRQPGEACDDGNRRSGDLCSADCTLPNCGNGRLDPGETCDDGNLIDGDTCESDCTRPRCGNRVVDRAEDCDDGNLTSGDGCSTACHDEVCGNGIVSSARVPMGPLEQCDDGNVVNGDGCDSNCTLSRCGNGIVGPPEECDDGNFEDGDGCDPNCRAPRCNNGHWDYRSETCDDGTAARDDGCDTDCSPSRCGAGIPASVCGGRAPIRSIEGGQAILLEDGTIWAWGANLHGAAGQPHGGVLLTPVQMAGINHARKFCTTADWSLVLQDDGGVLAAGWNLDGQLGVFGISYRNTFAPVPDLPPIVDISCGSSPMALASDGTLWAWGGITLSSPIQVQGAPSIVALGTTEVLAVDGSVWHIDPQFFAATAAPVPALGAGSVLRLNGPFAVLSNGTVALARDGQVIVSSPPLADFSGSQAIGIDGAFYAVDNPTGQTWQLTATSFPAPIVEAGSFGSDLVRLADGSVWARGDVPGDGSYRSLTYVPIANFP